MEKRQKEYIEPELKLAGDAGEVVLGLSTPGFDFYGMDIGIDMEFLPDNVKSEG